MGKSKIINLSTPVIRKQAGQLMKLFGLWPKSSIPSIEDTLRNPPRSEKVPNFLSQRKGLDTKFVTRRQIVLNRHFTEVISDVLLNNMSKQLSEMGVNITSIEAKAWNKGVDIFYYLENEKNVEFEQNLNSLMRQLRKSISEQKFIGRAPPVRFVIDKTVECQKQLDRCMELIKKGCDKQELGVTKAGTMSLSARSKESRLNASKDKLIGHRFSAPPDMRNTILGLDYPAVYNEIMSKFEWGRAESSRMKPRDAIAKNSPPIILGLSATSKEDPEKRIIKMQSFLINQRKKVERLTKLRRLDELLARDAVKWDDHPTEEEQYRDYYDEQEDEM